MTSTRVTRTIHAPRRRVYRALIDPVDVIRWRFPAGMSCTIHEFDAREGGTLRISLRYEQEDQAGKTSGHTDTYGGRFVRLVPDKLVVEADEFETDDPAFGGEMLMTITLRDAGPGTELVAVHDNLPSGVSAQDNETGWREALGRLAVLVEDQGSAGGRLAG